MGLPHFIARKLSFLHVAVLVSRLFALCLERQYLDMHLPLVSVRPAGGATMCTQKAFPAGGHNEVALHLQVCTV